MALFDYSKKSELARVLAENPKFYNHVKRTLIGLNDVGVLSKRPDREWQKDFDFLEEANNIARESDYFVFEVEDTWAENQGYFGDG